MVGTVIAVLVVVGFFWFILSLCDAASWADDKMEEISPKSK